MTPGTAQMYVRIFSYFVRFAAASGFPDVACVDEETCQAFVAATGRRGAPPAPSTSRFRLTVVRDAFKPLQAAGRTKLDPTQGLRVARGPQSRILRPLTPHEVSRLRSAGRQSPRDYLRPSAVELALAGGSHAEIANTVVAALDMQRGRVRFDERHATLDPFATATLAARLAACRREVRRTREDWDPDAVSVALPRPLSTYPVTSVAPTISANLRRALTNAGLGRAEIRPASIREYAANRTFALTGKVESVADLLGLASLDVARGFIDSAWQHQFGQLVRSHDLH